MVVHAGVRRFDKLADSHSGHRIFLRDWNGPSVEGLDRYQSQRAAGWVDAFAETVPVGTPDGFACSLPGGVPEVNAAFARN
jgi:hypothetical protein